MFAARADVQHKCLPVRNQSGHTGYRGMPTLDRAANVSLHGQRQVFVHGLPQLFSGSFSFFIMEHVLVTMKHLIARNLTAWQVVFQSKMAPGSPSLRFSLPFYNGLLEAGVAMAATSPHGAVELDLSHEPDYPATLEPPARCATCADLASHVRHLHSVPRRGERPLQLLLTRRSGTRCILNWDDLSASLAQWTAARGHTLVTPPADWHGVSGSEQVRIMAATDVHIGMHGASMSLSAFQPPGALVLEILPAGMYYCRQSACNSHEGMLWVQLQPFSVRQMLELSRRTMQKNREKGRRVEVSGLLRVLSEAFDSSIWSAFNFSRPPSCRVNTLGEWMHMWLHRKRAAPAARACEEALPASGQTPAYRHGARPNGSFELTTKWPQCVSSVLHM